MSFSAFLHMNIMNRTDVIIIGGGVAGLMSARELAEAGLRVTLLERQALAKESSWAGGGILSPLLPWHTPAPITALCRWSQAAYPLLAEALHQRTGTDPEWLKSGLLFCNCDDFALAHRWAEDNASQFDVLSKHEVMALEPQIYAPLINPVCLPDIAQVRNPRLLRALRQDLILRGVELREYHSVENIKIDRGQVTYLSSCDERFTADSYIVTAGAWSGLLMRNAGLPTLPVEPVKGEMIIFNAPPGLLKHMVISQGNYLIPRKDGKILAGSSVKHVQFNKSVTEATRQNLQEFAYNLLPPLRECPIEKHWAGLRPGSPNGIPTIGQHPDITNLYFNTGHFRNGFVMAPASAHLLADHVLGRPPIVSPAPYLLNKGN
jgi:glycine oxidase